MKPGFIIKVGFFGAPPLGAPVALYISERFTTGTVSNIKSQVF